VRAALAGALVVSALLIIPVQARAASTGSGNWYWPVGTEDFQGWDGWWEYRPQSPPRWHMAQDMPVPAGHPVYAIGDGTVLESGGDHGYGGVIVVLHKTADGHYFKAVYGHMYPAAGAGKGAHVNAGQVVGRVNGCSHLHFGIHPGVAYPPDRNPYRGHTYTSKNTYGWVDPVKYLRSNPRVLGYSAPGVPTVTTVETTGAATVLGVAEGSVYWSSGSDDLLHVFARLIDGDETLAVPEDSELPTLDTTRYAPSVEATSFSLADRLPLLTLATSNTLPSWKRQVRLSGRLVNALGAPFKGAKVAIESSTDGTSWSRVTVATTGLTGSFSATWAPTRRVQVRARFVAAGPYLTAASQLVSIAPRPSLSTPSAPTRAERNHGFTARGTLVPRHTAGSGAVVLRVQRMLDGVWVDYSTITASCRDSSAGTAYSRPVRLPKGTWRIRAQSPADTAHAVGMSAWATLTVR
jgi:hypothetical protein